MTASPSPAIAGGTGLPPAPRERVLTWPLAGFLLLVAAAVGLGWLQNHPRPDLPAAVRLLADGDLDGAERKRVLAGIVASAATAEGPMATWAVLLAAIALEDRAAYAAALARLGGGPSPANVPSAAERGLLHLGDPLLGDVLAGGVAEAAGAFPEARQRWQRVAVQSQLTRRVFAQELATAALARLPAPK